MTWTAEPEYQKDEAGEYLFTPAVPEDYELAEETELPEILVCLEKEQEQD